MIASLSGKIFNKQIDSLILDVGGVGYEVMISSRTYDALPAAGEDAFLLIRTNVREDAITLYGFCEQEEKDLFLLLNSVSGIGPKLALGILSGISAPELCQAISSKDFARLTALSGVGKKTSQRLCVELGEKVGALSGVTGMPGAAAEVEVEGFAMQDAVSALVNLGYPRNTAWQALRSIQQRDPEAAARMKVEELLRLALQAMA
ncbi:MAG: Holliday junction branch migration protein RuvA [Desulfobulbaceae bacterium]|nr:Holliday junction branch migration protein RuvA [Desulfobulbaceae bacterium]